MKKKFMFVSNIGEADLEVTITGTYRPGTPGKLSGPPENCYPPEDPEIEIESVTTGVQAKDIFDLLSKEAQEYITNLAFKEFEDYSDD